MAPIDSTLLAIPAGAEDVTVVRAIDGLSYIDPDDPAMPSYRVIANNRQPVALRDMMIKPVRTGYIGADQPKPDPALVPPSGAEAVPDVDVTVVYLPVRDGVACARVYRPQAAAPEASLPVILYVHGGGFTVGSSDDTDYLTRRLARDNGALVVSADYRLAPEYPFPTPLDDVVDVYRFLTTDASRLGGDAARIAVAGDSAGSNYAAVIPLVARERGLPAPSAVVMLGAFVDFVQERWDSFQRLAPRGIVYDSAFFGFIRSAYLPTTPWTEPLASPIYADLSAYPPAYLTAGTHDPIVDSAKAFVELLDGHGLPAVGYWPEGMPHGYYFFPGVHAEGDTAYGQVRAFLGRHL
ncbi:alpha/beta hydrolase [Agromyces aerolatus]|uniref:alpha/beta hydrolase n=1 Tax=Agromyces sp. LY-1074 TaxID=3074080 RepID=UPI002862FBAE|nr:MULTISPECIES: alpha/beta hydrolase [unclassified Agromyces]MDR5699631.1 alpha/beta hydrolase [Agromyces sp. LY-1074]MDR5705927.1 alpha/beta hydrolase [Agromyces sp. LY-1358]